MTNRRGFTLLEMLVVIIVIVILAGAAVAMMNAMLRGQGVRKGAMIITQAIAQTKQRASEKHRVHFLVFSYPMPSPAPTIGNDTGWMEIHEDTNMNGTYDGDCNPDTQDTDRAIEGKPFDLPKFVTFDNAPSWAGFSPSGYVTFNASFSDRPASEFDAIMNGPSPNAFGDIIIRIKGQPYLMCMDLDRAGGKIRRFFFLNEAPLQ